MLRCTANAPATNTYYAHKNTHNVYACRVTASDVCGRWRHDCVRVSNGAQRLTCCRRCRMEKGGRIVCE